MLTTIDGRTILTEIIVRIAGKSQDGVQVIGKLLASQTGMNEMGVITWQTYPATITGGESVFQVHIGSKIVKSSGDECDILVAFYEDSYRDNIEFLKPRGAVIYDSDEFTPPVTDKSKYIFVPLPMSSLTIRTLGGSAGGKGKNMVLLGFLSKLLGFDEARLIEKLKAKFLPKGETVFQNARNVFSVGMAYDTGSQLKRIILAHDPTLKNRKNQVTMNGNTALTYGIITAGIRFGAAYPITPATSVMEELRALLPRFGGMMIQAEDEIAAIAMALGASFGGRPAVTSTSGPGLSLKMEALGWGIMAEIPLLIINVMRGGPSTGLPTKVEQSDLLAACFGGHGDAPRVVCAPTCVRECFEMVINAINISREFSVPVILLSDAALSTRIETFNCPDIDATLQNLEPNFNAIPTHSPYNLKNFCCHHVPPGTIIDDEKYPVVTGLEHDETGQPNGTMKNHIAMGKKREEKLLRVKSELSALDVYGGDEGDLLVIAWGSCRGSVEDAIDIARKEGKKASSVCIRYFRPLEPGLSEILPNFKRIIVIEQNAEGQLAMLLRMELADPRIISRAKPGGLSLKIAEVTALIRDEFDALSASGNE